ncbi:MAG: DUF4231 domain-containing protein [Anaerolineae bacterium]|nr:DUF4231 domain-containing protein [Anaerolineae bacterium]
MSDQPSSSPPSQPRASDIASMTPPAPSPHVPLPSLPRSQGLSSRTRWPMWAKQLPYARMPAVQQDFQLIDPDELDTVLQGVDPAEIQRIKEDIRFLDRELLRLFRQQDREAAVQQNRYRQYQIGYIFLSALATLIGSLQALTLAGRREWMPWFAFGETVVALLATFLATISGREPPLPLYLNSRRRAESLRREYFRFLMNLEPYDSVTGARRRMLLSSRAANINRGVIPDEGK